MQLGEGSSTALCVSPPASVRRGDRFARRPSTKGRLTGTVTARTARPCPGRPWRSRARRSWRARDRPRRRPEGRTSSSTCRWGATRSPRRSRGFKTIVRENIDVSATRRSRSTSSCRSGGQRDGHGHRRGPARRQQDVHDRREDRPGAARQASDEPGCVLRPGADDAGHVRGVGRARTRFRVPPLTAARPTRTSSSSTASTRPIPEAGSFGTLVNVNYDAVEEVRVVGLGSKAEYGSFSGATVDVVTKSGSNEFHGSGAFYSLLGTPSPATSPPSARTSGRRSSTSAKASSSRARRRRTGRAAARSAVPIRQGQAVVLRRLRLPPQRQPASAVVARERVVGPLHRRQGVGRALQEPPRLGSPTTTRTTTATAGAGAAEPGVGHDDDLRVQDEEPHGLRRSGSGSASGKHDGQRQVPGVLEGRPALPARRPCPTIPATSTGGSGPTTASTARSRTSTAEGEPPDRAGRRLALRGGVPRRSTTSSSASSTRRDAATRQDGYFQNYVNFLYPYRWTQNVSVPAELVRRHRTAVLQLARTRSTRS